MNLQDPIETRLRRLRLRTPPSEWRAAVLSAARSAAPPRARRKSATIQGLWLDWLQALLWPSPRAWAILAGCWLVTLALQWSLPTSESSVPASAPSPAELAQRWQAWLERKRYMAELIREWSSQWEEPVRPDPAPALPPRQTLVEPLRSTEPGFAIAA